MDQAIDAGATCRVVRQASRYQGKQGPTYAGGVSAERVGAKAIWLGMATMSPGSRTKAHFHEGHETALYVLEGECEVWFGDDLERQERIQAGDYLYIPAGVPHIAVNRSEVQPLVVVLGRTDPREQESVVLRPDLDHKVPG